MATCWVMVDLKLEGVFAEPLPLERLKQEKQLEGMELLRRGSRLSVQPVTAVQFRHIMKLAGVTKVSLRRTDPHPGARRCLGFHVLDGI